MCGIFGLIGDFDVDDFRILQLLNEKRGTDNFGMYDGKYIFKSALKARENLDRPFDADKEARFLMGHTRSASYNMPTKKHNAHPFEMGPVVGAHNGSVYNFDYLKKKLSVDVEMEVDSEIIFWGLWKMGFEIFKEISGSWTLSWYDKRAPEYFWVANNSSDLAIAESGNALAYSSDIKDLEALGMKGFRVPDETAVQIHIPTLKIQEFKVEVYSYTNYDRNNVWKSKRKEYRTTHLGLAETSTKSSVIVGENSGDKNLALWTNPLGPNKEKLIT